MKSYAKILLALTAIFGLYILFLWSMQRYLLFWPSHDYVSPQEADLPEFTENPITATDGTVFMTWYAAGDKSKPAILFFHSNAFQISEFAPHLMPFVANGYGILAMEYRNFGNTKGTTLQEDIFADAATAYDWLQAQGYPEIIVYGYSYGTAVASGLTTLRPVEKLILTAPFASMRGLVAEKSVPLGSLVMRDTYPSKDYLQQYHGALLIIHGKKDLLIPVHHGQMLYDAAASADKELVLLPATNHHNIFFKEKNLPIIFAWMEKHKIK
jgi:pimeloyl-ACP methyl ester carboxylesterase